MGDDGEVADEGGIHRESGQVVILTGRIGVADGRDRLSSTGVSQYVSDRDNQRRSTLY